MGQACTCVLQAGVWTGRGVEEFVGEDYHGDILGEGGCGDWGIEGIIVTAIEKEAMEIGELRLLWSWRILWGIIMLIDRLREAVENGV